MTELINNSNSMWLLQWIRNRIKKNRNLIALFIGDTGSGKSYSSIRLAETIDPAFSVDRIVFTVEDFMKLINSGLPKGSVIIFDDAGLGINARLWQEASAIVFGMVTQGFRYKQIILFITVPDDTFIERQSRRLVHIRFESTDVQGLMKPKLISRNTFDPEHPLAKYPIIRRGIKKITIKLIKFQMPSKEIVEPYEIKKNEYMESQFKKFQEQLGEIDPTKLSYKNGKPAIRVQCDECGYEWNYTGIRRKAKCPSCDHSVFISEMEEKRTGIEVTCKKCEYTWTYTGGAKRTVCPNCEQHVRTTLEDTQPKKTDSTDPFDPMNTPVRPGMSKEEISDILVEKLIKQGIKIDETNKDLIELLSQMAEKELKERQQEKDGGEDEDEAKE